MVLTKRYLAERIKGEWQLRKLAYRYAPGYRRDVNWAVAGLLGAILAATTLGGMWSVLLFAVGLLVSGYGLWAAIVEIKDIRPTWDNSKYSPSRASRIMKDGRKFDFRDVFPSPEETDLGFYQVVAGDAVVHLSDRLDDKIMLSNGIAFSEVPTPNTYLAGPVAQKRRQAQMAYLYHTVRNATRTTNDPKVAMMSSCADLPSRIAVGQVTYFDGLLTQEAYTSVITKEPTKDNEAREIISDGTEFYPAKPSGDRLLLDPMPVQTLTSHLGCAAFVLSHNGTPLFARQSDKNLISAGKLVSRASGSMDVADLGSFPRVSDFRQVVKTNMARECAEETGFITPTNKKAHQSIVDNMVDCTLVTGFFRTVDRAGKPDFVGVIRLSDKFEESGVDDFEIELAHDVGLDIKPITSMDDFAELHRQVIDKKINLSVSSYAALYRLSVIAGYQDCDDSDKKEVLKLTADFLSLSYR